MKPPKLVPTIPIAAVMTPNTVVLEGNCLKEKKKEKKKRNTQQTIK